MQHHSLRLINPSNKPVYVEPILLQHCSQPKLVLETLSSTFEELDPAVFQPTVTAFSLIPAGRTDTSLPSQEPVSAYVIPPYGNMSVWLKFTPDLDQWMHGMLVLRNNFTALDYVHLKGLGSWGFVTVSGVHPVETGNGGRSLLFEFSPMLMEGCMATECECKQRVL